MNQRPLIAVLVVTAMALGAVAWWAGRSVPAPAASVQRRDVVASAWTRSDVEPAQLELPTKPGASGKPSSESASESWRAEVEKTRPEWVSEILRSTFEKWKTRIEQLPFEQRSQLKQKIYDYVYKEAAPDLERMRLDKEWEFIGPAAADGSNSYSGAKADERLIYSVVMVPKEGLYKIVLPREKFPDLYTLKERADALFSW